MDGLASSGHRSDQEKLGLRGRRRSQGALRRGRGEADARLHRLRLRRRLTGTASAASSPGSRRPPAALTPATPATSSPRSTASPAASTRGLLCARTGGNSDQATSGPARLRPHPPARARSPTSSGWCCSTPAAYWLMLALRDAVQRRIRSGTNGFSFSSTIWRTFVSPRSTGCRGCTPAPAPRAPRSSPPRSCPGPPQRRTRSIAKRLRRRSTTGSGTVLSEVFPCQHLHAHRPDVGVVASVGGTCLPASVFPARLSSGEDGLFS